MGKITLTNEQGILEHLAAEEELMINIEAASARYHTGRRMVAYLENEP